MKITLKISKSVITIFKLCLILFALLAAAFLVYLAYEQYIIYRTEQTYNMLRKAYEKTIETSDFQWEKGKMNTGVLAEAFIKNLPVEKKCNFTNDGTCFPKQAYFTADALLTKGKSLSMNYSYKVLLKNGIGITIAVINPSCELLNNRCGEIYVDVNGPFKGPNRLSRDIFDFSIFKDRVETYNIEGNHFPNCVYGGGHACAAYLLKFKNRNYKSYKNYVKRHHLENTNMGEWLE